MVLVADSGSTKTQWVTEQQSITTQGINPVRDSEEQILNVISTELMPSLSCKDSVTEVYFYGAGCIEPFLGSVRSVLEKAFPVAHVEVKSDLLGAARALCGRNEGIACILGTGSNSCLCREGEIISNVSPLGFILGDEGSGAVLGKRFVGDMLKGQLSTTIWDEFQDSMQLSVSDIIDHVYRKPQANKFLASLVPFISAHKKDEQIHALLLDEFGRFLQRNVALYNRPDLPVNFVGGIASEFENEISLSIEQNDMKRGLILKKPAPKMLEYHLNGAKKVTF